MIFCGDFFALTEDQVGEVDAVYDRASVISLPPASRSRYAEKMASLLSANTQSLLITIDYPQNQMKGPPFSVPDSEVQSLFGANFQIEHLQTLDVLADHQRFADRGVTQMTESCYRLIRL